MSRRVFTPEFKESAVRLVAEQNYGVREAARSLGIPVNTLRSWIKAHRCGKAVPGEGQSQDQALRKRVRELEMQVEKLKTEREILKKAAAFFAKEHP